jgi:hypothetical protein
MNHQGKPPTLVINARCPQYLEPLKKQLADAGFWAIQSFDLQSTRTLHEEGCTCPHHDTNQCTCEMVVLLVYPASGDPVTVMLDGRDNRTYVYLLNDPRDSPPAATLDSITQVLLSTAYQILFAASAKAAEM